MTWTSAMLGTFFSVVTPGAMMVAAMSLSAEFLAPSTVTSPVTACPPSTLMTSMFLPHMADGPAFAGPSGS